MTSILSIRFWVAIILTVVFLQYLPQIISPKCLFFNNNFFFGIIESNNLAIIISLVFLLIVFYYQKYITNRSAKIAIALIIAGTSSNILDRLFRGGAIDYISIWIWPIFNFADVLIVLGIIIFLSSRFLKTKKPRFFKEFFTH